MPPPQAGEVVAARLTVGANAHITAMALTHPLTLQNGPDLPPPHVGEVARVSVTVGATPPYYRQGSMSLASSAKRKVPEPE